MGDETRRDTIGEVVVKGVTVSSIGNLVLRFLDFFTAVLLLRGFSIFEFGVYRLSLAAYDLAAGLFLAGIENVVVSDVSGELQKNERRAKSLFSVYFFFMALVGAGLWALFFFAPSFLISWSGTESRYIRIISFLFLLAPIETAYKLAFQIFLDFGWGNFFRILRGAGRLILLLVFFFFFSFGIEEVLWSLFLAVALPVVVAIFGYRRTPLVIIPLFSELREGLRTLFMAHGRWALLDDLVSNSGKNIRPFIIKTFVGVEAVAIIAVAQNLVAYTRSLFSVRDVLLPVLPRFTGHKEDLKKQINRAAKYSIAGNLILGIAAAALAPLFIWFFFPKYLLSLPFFYLLLIDFPWHGLRSVLLPVFYALKEQRILFRLTAARLIFTLVAGVLFTYLLGIWGAALELMLVGVVITPVFIRALQKILPGWRFRLRDLVSFDAADREFYRKTRDRILAKVGLYCV